MMSANQIKRRERNKYIAGVLCARNHDKPLGIVPSPNLPNNPGIHVLSFLTFYKLGIRMIIQLKNKGRSQGQNQAAPFHRPWLLSTRQSCAPFFSVMKLLRQPQPTPSHQTTVWNKHPYSVGRDRPADEKTVSEQCNVASKTRGREPGCILGALGQWLLLCSPSFLTREERVLVLPTHPSGWW